MGYILLGHGGLDLDAGAIPEGMGTVAIPAGTTLQFYSETGQALVYGNKELDLWAQLQTPWPALDSTRVTYNLTLSSAKELWDDELKNHPSFAGNTLIRAGVDGVPDPIKLCNGTVDTCPTDPRQVLAGKTHTCDDVLGTYKGDLYWLACTSIENSAEGEQLATTARGGTQGDVNLGANPDEAHDTSVAVVLPFDGAAADSRNQAVLKALDDGDETYFLQGGPIVLIGDGHAVAAIQALYLQEYAQGTVRIKKGGMMSSGKLKVSGCPDEAVFEAAVGRISDKSVEFE
jgi:hypothetical protein